MKDEKLLMAEAAILYYRENKTQQEIAKLLSLSRQTVSKLLSDAIAEKVVEIIIHDPQAERQALEQALCDSFGIRSCVICPVSGKNETLARLMTVRAAAEYLLPLLQAGGLKIALSWGRTVEELIGVLPRIATEGNTVFPLFGATDTEKSYFSSNELARSLADKLSATVKSAWFPYLAENEAECALLQQLSCYRNMEQLWDSADLAILGIGSGEILDVFASTFGSSPVRSQAVGDLATHFFNAQGEFLPICQHTLRAGTENLLRAKHTVAVACGAEKVAAIGGALRTGLVHTLITDEHTAQKLLSN